MALTQHSLARRRQIAEALGIDEQYVYQISTGRKTASPALARRWNEIESTDSLQDLRPDDWRLIWPELIDQQKDEAQAEAQGIARSPGVAPHQEGLSNE